MPSTGIAGCQMAVGRGLGAVVTDTIPGTPAAGAIFPGDVITSVGGVPVDGPSALVDAVQLHAIDTTVPVTIERDGEGISIDITLRESAEVTGLPILGVMVNTHNDLRTPTEIRDLAAAVDGPHIRPVAIEGGIWLLDPEAATWEAFAGILPPAPWVAIGSELYALDLTATGGPAIVGILGGTAVAVAAGDWQVQALLTSMGDSIILAAQETTTDGTEAALLSVDPVIGAARWVWTPLQVDSDPAPRFAYRSPQGDSILVGLSAPDAITPTRYVIITEQNGTPDSRPAPAPPGSVVFGWHDESTIISVVDAIDEVFLTEISTGETIESSMPLVEVPNGLWPVGDGQFVIVAAATGLQLAEVGGRERRPITQACTIGLVGERGWTPPA